MVLDKSLEEILKMVGHKHGTTTKEIVKVLDSCGIKSDNKLKLVKSDRLVPNVAILKLKHKNHSNWHWVVFNNGLIYDPATGIFHSKELHLNYSKYVRISSYIGIYYDDSNESYQLEEGI
jgi:hypothetical protein